MKHNLKLLTAILIALGLPVAAYANATLTQAQITAIIKDVQTIDPGKGARAAIMKETLQGDQSVRTGIESRTELLFNDHTITRLGANTHFSFTEGTRNMSLQSGVMLLQVPKGIGGAKIETAAVTAAVTGTTIMIEAGKTYTKLIVLEGECCLWPKNDKKNNKFFKFKHKTCATEGQEIIMRNGSDVVPDPVYVNLKILEGTSLLITGNWGSQLNNTPINNAANGQGPGTYIPTNLAIIGAGTDVTVIQGQLPVNPPGGPGNPPPSGGLPPITGTPPSKYGPLFTIPNSHGYSIGGGSSINTDPKITANGVTSYGRVYRGLTLDGSPVTYFFGSHSGISETLFDQILETKEGELITQEFPNYGVAAFKFSDLTLNGTPSFEMSGNGANDLALISVGNIEIAPSGSNPYDFSALDILALGTAHGTISIDEGVTIQGLTGGLELYAGSGITMNGDLNLPGAAFRAATLGDYTEGGNVTADTIELFAETGLTENGDITAADNILLYAKGTFGGSGNLSAPEVDLHGGGLMTLNETNPDDTNVDTVNGVVLDMTALSTLTITGNGINVPNGFTGKAPEAEGPTVDLTLTSNNKTGEPGTITLSGNIEVDSLNATADADITASANITSNNEIDLTSNNGDVTISGQDQASSFQISGNIITTTGGASLIAESDGFGPITFSSNGDNNVILDGVIEGSDISITGYDVLAMSTQKGDGITGDSSVDIYAINKVILAGQITTPSLLVTGINGGPVPAGLDILSSASIDANQTTLYAGVVDMDGSVFYSSNEDGAESFTVDTTSSGAALVNVNGHGSLEDFYSGAETGSIDANTIQVNSRGDLILDETESFQLVQGIGLQGEVPSLPILNGISIDPNFDLTELDLTGATIEVPDGYFNEVSTLNLTSTGGDISIGGDIDVGIDNETAGVFSANASGNIDVTDEPTITADTVTLTAGQITTDEGGLTVNASSITMTVNNVVGNLSQSNLDFPQDLEFDESAVGEGPGLVGFIDLEMNGSDPVLSISANTLTTGNLDFSSFDSFSLTLISQNDINAGSSATISGATSLALQVGVTATLAGDSSSNIDYNGTQLTINDSGLTSFSVTAPAIIVNSGFPDFFQDTSIDLTSNTGDITSHVSLYTQGSLTLYSAGAITVDGNVSSYNDADFTASNGITVTDNVNVGVIDPVAGSINFTAYNNNIWLKSDVTVSDGDLTLLADNGNITIGNGDSETNVSGNFSVTASGTIKIENNVSLDGELTFSAGDIAINGAAPTFSGVTSANLTLTEPAVLTETFGEDDLLNFGSASHLPREIIIDLAESSVTSVSATGSSLTLSGSFNVPDIDITATASSGTLSVSGTAGVTASSFTGYSTNGDIIISEPLMLTNDFYASATFGNVTINSSITAAGFTAYSFEGDITLNAPVNVSTFYADADDGNLVLKNTVVATESFYGVGNSILGSGSISSPSVTLTQGGTATLTQTAPTKFTFNNVNVTLSADEGNSLLLAAGPLVFTNDLSFPSVSVNLSGILNTQNHTLTADAVYAYNLQTTTDASGNATNLTFTGNTDVTLSTVSLDGADSTAGSGGTLTATGTATPSSIVSVYGIVTANGGSAGGNGGTINLNAGYNINSGEGSSIEANGGAGGGNGGTIDLTAQGTIFSLGLSANGGDANSTGPAAGGNGGMVDLTTGTDIDVQGSVTANGGAANSASSAKGGNGGTVTINSAGAISVDNSITATTGANGVNVGTTNWTGGNGGTVNLTAQGEVTVNSSIQVSSSDLVNNVVSSSGGHINVTSHAATGVAINITDSGQLAALLNQAAPGPGGAITFLADKGGSINVSGSMRADHGTINIQNTAPTGAAVALSGASLSGDVVKVGALGSNGTLTIGNTSINGDTAIELYAAGSNGSVVFNGNTSLTGASVKSIAGSTVTVNNGVAVKVSGGPATVYTTTPNYLGSGGNGSTTGQFTGNGATTKPFASRPGF